VRPVTDRITDMGWRAAWINGGQTMATHMINKPVIDQIAWTAALLLSGLAAIHLHQETVALAPRHLSAGHKKLQRCLHYLDHLLQRWDLALVADRQSGLPDSSGRLYELRSNPAQPRDWDVDG
jgi:hypothetical protein